MLSLKVHNVLDYIIGAALLASPYVFGFSEIPDARNVFVVIGGAWILYSLLTRYRYSVLKLIPLGVHMALDAAASVILMLWPTFSAYRDQLTGFQYALHFIFGIGALVMVTLTRTLSESSVSPEDRQDVESPRKAA